VVTGIVQGTFATIGFWITGVPEPIFFGALTMIASFVPIAGVLLVIVPACIGLSFARHPIRGIIELAWGLVFVVGVARRQAVPAVHVWGPRRRAANPRAHRAYARRARNPRRATAPPAFGERADPRPPW
jgi:hypothetical protein